MNQHRYQFLYLPLHRLAERMSGTGRFLLWAGQALLLLALLSLALLRANVI